MMCLVTGLIVIKKFLYKYRIKKLDVSVNPGFNQAEKQVFCSFKLSIKAQYSIEALKKKKIE